MQESTCLQSPSKRHSSVLFARPSFAEGVSRIFDLGGTLSVCNRCETGEDADYWAIWSDWCAIGSDLQSAAQELEVH
jgi:hypothetical protein